MKMHVLPGDAIVEDFRKTNLEGEMIICRECLIEGDLRAANLEEFWRVRAGFIEKAHAAGEEKYFTEVAGELEKLRRLPSGAKVYLWFEYELFCQTNLWFCLYLLGETEAEIYRVMPVVRTETDLWKGFGGLEAGDLKKCFEARVRFGQEDVSLGVRLWLAYQASDYETLEELSRTESKCFPFLKEVCRAEIEKGTRPKSVLREITENGSPSFAEIFKEFSLRAGVYGFGDSQVKRLLGET